MECLTARPCAAAELKAYDELWNAIEETDADVSYSSGDSWGEAAGHDSITLLRTSGLSDKELKMVWRLAKSAAGIFHGPPDKLSKEEFVIGCRLIAHAQNGSALTPASVLTARGIPRLNVARARGIMAQAARERAIKRAAEDAELAESRARADAAKLELEAELAELMGSAAASSAVDDAKAQAEAAMARAERRKLEGTLVEALGAAQRNGLIDRLDVAVHALGAGNDEGGAIGWARLDAAVLGARG